MTTEVEDKGTQSAPVDPEVAPGKRLDYVTTPWKAYRQDAGMGEIQYALFLNDVFFCMCPDEYRLNLILGAFEIIDNGVFLSKSMQGLQ